MHFRITRSQNNYSVTLFYNLFQEAKSRPDWVDAVWGYFMIVQIANIVALYRAYPVPEDKPTAARAQ